MENSDEDHKSTEPDTSWQFSSNNNISSTLPDDSIPDRLPPPAASSVSWSAAEFIEHGKNASWYLLLFLGALIFAGVVFLLTKDKITTGVIIFCALIFGVYGARKPRTLHYMVDEHGLTIGTKFYSYGTFRSYSLVDEGPLHSLLLLPLRRFMPMVTIYYQKDDEDKIVGVLSRRLPLDNQGHDTMEKMLRRIKF